jgi:predicted MFS family arabinose efflux permease
VLGVLGLGAVVFALIEWPRPDANSALIETVLPVGVVALITFVVVESRVAAPMVRLSLFRSRTFTLANVLTLLLYGALATVFWLVPLNLIEVQHYSATGAGAALLPFPILMFVLSRWSGGLVARVGGRLPLTAGPVVAAAGLLLFARPGIGGPYWTTFLPAVAVLGLGTAIVVAPLTTTVMTAVEAQHAGVASGVNNAVSRVAGLIAIAVFGIVLVRAFDAHVTPALDRVTLSAGERSAVDRELPKLAGAGVAAVSEPARRVATRRAIDESFVSAFRQVMEAAAGVALAAAVAGSLIHD